MFLANFVISGHYWKESRLNSQYSQPVLVSDPTFSTFPYLTHTAVPNCINSLALDCSQVFLVLGTPEMDTELQFSAVLSISLPSSCWQLPSSSSPRNCWSFLPWGCNASWWSAGCQTGLWKLDVCGWHSFPCVIFFISAWEEI